MIYSTKNYQYWLFCASYDQNIRIRIVVGGNWAFEAVEASEVAEVAEVNEAGEDSKALKITIEGSRVFQVLEFNNLGSNITLF